VLGGRTRRLRRSWKSKRAAALRPPTGGAASRLDRGGGGRLAQPGLGRRCGVRGAKNGGWRSPRAGCWPLVAGLTRRALRLNMEWVGQISVLSVPLSVEPDQVGPQKPESGADRAGFSRKYAARSDFRLPDRRLISVRSVVQPYPGPFGYPCTPRVFRRSRVIIFVTLPLSCCRCRLCCPWVLGFELRAGAVPRACCIETASARWWPAARRSSWSAGRPCPRLAPVRADLWRTYSRMKWQVYPPGCLRR
jgi:hypothetical protein